MTYYSHAPIKEAVIEIRVDDDESFDVSSLSNMHESIGRPDAKVNPIFSGFAKVEFGAEGAIPTTHSQNRLIGFSYSSNLPKAVVQAKVDGFVSSVLEPYDKWETFRDASVRAWNAYNELRRPQSISRVGVRYINRFDIRPSAPSGSIRIEDYFRFYPETPATTGKLELGLSSYFVQLQMHQPDLGADLVVIHSLRPLESSETVPFIFDIDLFTVRALELGDDDKLWDYIEKLRARKNEAFEAGITDTVREMIK